MSKRSRDASFSPTSGESRSPAVEDELDALANSAPPAKFSQTADDAPTTLPPTVMQCSLAPHRETVSFDTQEEYGIHYTKEHTNRCATCSKNFPSPRFLELHIEENHNALREVLAARGEKTYGCFVEDCDRKCSTPQKRRLHLIDKHMFPKTYNFRVVDHGIDKALSLLREGRRRRVSTTSDNHQTGRHRRQASSQLQDKATYVAEGKAKQRFPGSENEGSMAKVPSCEVDARDGSKAPDGLSVQLTDDLDILAQSLSSLRFVPSSVLRKQNTKLVRPHVGRSEEKANGNGHE
jgi:hypothetical protein